MRNGGADIFFLFHRRRLWNEAQGCWMGWERKRGKLLEFNRLLRGARDTSYAVLSADPASLPRIQFCDHARRRHADAARHGRASGRDAGPPSQSAAVRRGSGAGRVGLWGACSRESAST